VSGILWREMLAQGMVQSRSEATRFVKQNAVRVKIGGYEFRADFDDLDLPGRTVVNIGNRRRIEIPVTPPEGDDGCINIRLQDVK
jgi:hypothetical protein